MKAKVKSLVGMVVTVVFCVGGSLADLVFIAALFNNMKIFEGNRLGISALYGEWGLAVVITLVGLFLMGSAGHKWASSFLAKNRVFAGIEICLWVGIGVWLAHNRVKLANEAGLNQSLIFEAVMLLMLFAVAGVCMFSVGRGLVNKDERDEAHRAYAKEAILKQIERCRLIENGQDILISQIRQLNIQKEFSIAQIRTEAIINRFRTSEGIIVDVEDIPLIYMK